MDLRGRIDRRHWFRSFILLWFSPPSRKQQNRRDTAMLKHRKVGYLFHFALEIGSVSW